MEGPRCSAYVKLDISGMKDGDRAGFAAFNGNSGVLMVCRDGGETYLTMQEQVVALTEREKLVTSVEIDEKGRTKLEGNTVYLRIDADFNPNRDIATFYYSVDGKNWYKIGSNFKMVFDYRRFFMGTRYAIFNYATKQAGGYVDVDDFQYAKNM